MTVSYTHLDVYKRQDLPSRPVFCCRSLLYDLPQDVAHGLGCLILLLPGGVGVGAQGEPGVKVPQHGGHRFYIYAILRGRGGEGVPQIVEPEMSQSGILQDFLVEIHHAVRVVHLPSEGREKQIGVSGCLSCSWMSSSTACLLYTSRCV